MVLQTQRTLPTHNCRFIATWTVNGKIWASTFEIEDGELFEFDNTIDAFTFSDLNFVNDERIENAIFTIQKK